MNSPLLSSIILSIDAVLNNLNYGRKLVESRYQTPKKNLIFQFFEANYQCQVAIRTKKMRPLGFNYVAKDMSPSSQLNL